MKIFLAVQIVAFIVSASLPVNAQLRCDIFDGKGCKMHLTPATPENLRKGVAGRGEAAYRSCLEKAALQRRGCERSNKYIEAQKNKPSFYGVIEDGQGNVIGTVEGW